MVKNPPANAGHGSSIPGSGRSPGVGNGNLLRYSCLENSMNRGTQWATDHGVTKSQIHTTEHRTVGGKKSPINYQEDFPGCPVVKSLPDNAGDKFNPWSRKIPHATEQLGPMHHNKRTHRNGSPGTATREQPLLTATSEKPVPQRRPQHSQI